MFVVKEKDYLTQSTPQYDLPDLQGPDSGISAIIPADKYASLRQAKNAENKFTCVKNIYGLE